MTRGACIISGHGDTQSLYDKYEKQSRWAGFGRGQPGSTFNPVAKFKKRNEKHFQGVSGTVSKLEINLK